MRCFQASKGDDFCHIESCEKNQFYLDSFGFAENWVIFILLSAMANHIWRNWMVVSNIVYFHPYLGK